MFRTVLMRGCDLRRIFGGAVLDVIGRGKARTTFKDIAGIDQVLCLEEPNASTKPRLRNGALYMHLTWAAPL